jgi:nicotinamide riboside kinase
MSPGSTPTPVRRVAVVGAECVGKTSLCRALAEAVDGLWVPEYLREFCDRIGRTPRADEQRHVLATQIELEASYQHRASEQGAGWLFCDSAPIVTALYSTMLFDDPSLQTQAQEHHRHYWATLLLTPDLPWITDGIQRDGPTVRTQFHDLLSRHLTDHGTAIELIFGRDLERIDLARKALDALRRTVADDNAASTHRASHPGR